MDWTVIIAAGGAGVLLVDVTEPRAPIELAALDTSGFARGVAVAATHALIADLWSGVRVVDVVDPRRPIEIGALATRSWAFDVVVKDSAALTATSTAVRYSSRTPSHGFRERPFTLPRRARVPLEYPGPA